VIRIIELFRQPPYGHAFPFPLPLHLAPLFLHPQRMNEPVPNGLGEYAIGQVHTLGPHHGERQLLGGLRAVGWRLPKARPA